MDGVQILDHVRASYPDLPVIVISGPRHHRDRGQPRSRRGRTTFWKSRSSPSASWSLVERAMEAARLQARERRAQAQDPGEKDHELIGTSPAIQQAEDRGPARRADQQLAGADHRPARGRQGGRRPDDPRQLAARRRRRSSSINAATMAPERMDMELFGCEPGFLGARPGHGSDRRLRARRRRHAPPRRGGRHAARNPRQDPSRAPGAAASRAWVATAAGSRWTCA
jgi:two-component system, NtrC family, nitrogen regulation response regulator NtrX